MNERDTAIVRLQIGRRPRGSTEVAARCEHGLPSVVRTEPVMDSGAPFPTLYWLTCPAAASALGRLEAGGRMRDLNERLASDPALAGAYTASHLRYIADRDGPDHDDAAVSAGGMPERVKCLHALVAHDLAGGENPIGAIAGEEIEPLGCPGPCAVEAEDGSVVPAPGHPDIGRRGRT